MRSTELERIKSRIRQGPRVSRGHWCDHNVGFHLVFKHDAPLEEVKKRLLREGFERHLGDLKGYVTLKKGSLYLRVFRTDDQLCFHICERTINSTSEAASAFQRMLSFAGIRIPNQM